MGNSIPALATPTFMSGVNDALAVADVYDLVSPGVITDIESILSEISSISSALLGSGILNSDSVTSLQAVAPNSGAATSGVTVGSAATSSTTSTSASTAAATAQGITTGDAVDQQTLLTRLGTTSTQLNSAIRGLSANAQATITSGLNNNASSVQQVTIGDTTTAVNSASYADIAQVASIVNAFTGTNNVVSTDVQAFASIISGIVQICANLGVPNSFAAITSQITDPAILTTAVGLCLQPALAAGDLQSIVSMANKLSPSVVISSNPTLITTYVSNFNNNYYTMMGFDTSSANDMLNAVVNALAQIDPNWNTGTRNGISLRDVSSWMGANPAFIQLLTNASKRSVAEEPSTSESTGEILDQTDALAYLFAAKFGKYSVIQELEKDYPLVTLTTNEAVAMAIDPSSMLTIN